MYLTQNDIIKLLLVNNGNYTAGQALKEIVTDDEQSQEKKDMREGIDYYNVRNKILDHDFRVYYLEKKVHINENKSNNLIAHPYMGLLNDQKAAYMVGKPISITSENEVFSKSLNKLFGKRFDDLMNTFVINSANQGVEYLHPYINQRGRFDYLLANAIEIIPVYDTQFQKELVGVIRYYKVAVREKINVPPEYRYRIEVWDHEKVTFYIENSDKEIVLDPDEDPNPRLHWYLFNSINPGIKKGFSWGRVPFVQFKNNDLMKSDLSYTKFLIDDYDFQVSDMSNKLVNIARLVWVLQGYEGTNLAEFVKNLESFGAIKVKEKGAVDPKSVEIPHEAHNAHLDRLEDNIYIFGRGVNMRKTNAFGNSPNTTALKLMHGLLDLKCNGSISKLTLTLEDLSWFATQYLNMTERKNYDYEMTNYTFNKSLILNEKELVEMGQQSKGIIDDETIISHHPWVDDPKKVMARLKKQREEAGINLDEIDDNEDNGGEA